MSDESMILYPFDHVFGIVDDLASVEAVLAEMTEKDVPEDDIVVLTGEEGVKRIDAGGSSHGLLARMWRALQFATMDALPDAERYEGAARAGSWVVAVRAKSDERRQLVHQSLKSHGGYFINHYGKLTTTPLE
jgi:hypothetical protein